MLAPNDIRAQVAAIRSRVAEARRRAARAEAVAVRMEAQLEGLAALSSEPLTEACLRMAALHRRAQVRHLDSAMLQDEHANRLCAWLAQQRAHERLPEFMEDVAATIGMRSATVTLLGERRGDTLVAASDETARAALDLEFVFGEGPARLAALGSRPIAATGLTLSGRWPQYGPALAGLGVEAVIAVPLQPEAGLGVVCGYDCQPTISAKTELAIRRLAEALPLMLAQAQSDGLPADGALALPLLSESNSMGLIYQAAGMVSQQSGCDIGDALALLRARAYASGIPAEQIAISVLRGELRLCLCA
jgi:hypothetical protein